MTIKPTRIRLYTMEILVNTIIACLVPILTLACALTLTLYLRERERAKKLQNALVRSELMASLGKLVASVTHDINSSVGVCVSAASYLGEAIDEANRAFTEGTLKKSDLARHFALEKESADILGLNLKKAADLVAGFKRISVDQATGSLQEFGLREYIDQIVMSLTPKLRKTPHRIEILCDSSLRMQGYPWAISQILTNLISNSLTHAFGDKEKGTIRILAERQGDRLILTYSDDGRGMSEYVRSHAFTPFFTTKSQDGGTGLGLSIARDLAENILCGSITCESTPGVGTIFTLNIPLSIDAQGTGPDGLHHKEKRP